MRCIINAQVRDIPVNPDGTIDADAFRTSAGVPPNRILVLQRSDGSNQILNPGESHGVQPEDVITALPDGKRGG